MVQILSWPSTNLLECRLRPRETFEEFLTDLQRLALLKFGQQRPRTVERRYTGAGIGGRGWNVVNCGGS